mmetsp:Transcript_15845/g.23536  ORF Transcript_15845/g.23536 Transcript_15845/m.23536 type:complete len:698 (+) Transcript_15845:100-2193(+)
MDDEIDGALSEPLIASGGSGTQRPSFMARILAACGCSSSNEAGKYDLAPYQELYISPKVYKRSVNALRFAVFVDAIAGTIEQPNYPIMVLPGAHPDSFPDTGGLGFSGATYMVPMSALLGVAIASMIIGRASDKVGRKPCILFCLYGTVIGCILKFLFRFAFWPYCAFNFLNGLVSASVPVALAYAGDVNETKREKDGEIGVLVGVSMLGSAGGGIIAILMETQGLFVPLLVGSAIVFVAAVLNTLYLIEPKDVMASRQREREELGMDNEIEDDDDDQAQTVDKLDYKVFSLILLGALGDNVGSSGLMPLCLSPLAFQTFYTNADPVIMSQVAYKWVSVLVALMVVPGTIVSPYIYNKLGLAGGCIMGNVITGIVTIFLLYIALAPASTATFGIFVALLYACFPFTVISQLSTGPMLEATSPPDKRGLAQGVNITVMNLGAAVSPFVLGAISDMAGTPTAIWICIAISFIAALINIPLIWVKGCNIPAKPRTGEKKPLKGEDKEMVEKALRGEWIPAEALEEIQEERYNNKQPYLVVPVRSYAEEKDELKVLRKRAKEDFIYYQRKNNEYLHRYNTLPASERRAFCDQINRSSEVSNQDEVDAANADVGKWFADYLIDSGYHPHTDSTAIKQLIMTSFPVVNKGAAPFHPLNIERILLEYQKGYTRLIEMEGYDEGNEMRIGRVLQSARSVIYMQSI